MVDDMTKNGQMCRERAILECERRFFGNETEETFDDLDDEVAKKVKIFKLLNICLLILILLCIFRYN